MGKVLIFADPLHVLCDEIDHVTKRPLDIFFLLHFLTGIEDGLYRLGASARNSPTTENPYYIEHTAK